MKSINPVDLRIITVVYLQANSGACSDSDVHSQLHGTDQCNTHRGASLSQGLHKLFDLMSPRATI
jgi:hypothetical protein